MRSQKFAISSWGGRRFRPYVFTEYGAIQAANVLRSTRAIEMSLYIVRAFVQLREMLASDLGVPGLTYWPFVQLSRQCPAHQCAMIPPFHDFGLSLFSTDLLRARSAYEQFILQSGEADEDLDHRSHAEDSCILGTDSFIKRTRLIPHKRRSSLRLRNSFIATRPLSRT